MESQGNSNHNCRVCQLRGRVGGGGSKTAATYVLGDDRGGARGQGCRERANPAAQGPPWGWIQPSPCWPRPARPLSPLGPTLRG